MLQVVVFLLCVAIASSVWGACDQSAAAQMGMSVFSEVMTGGAGYPKALSTAYRFIEDCWKQQEPSEPDQYDITINGDWTFLRELGGEGWTVQVQDDLHSDCDQIADVDGRRACYEQALMIKGCYVSWTGGFNNGKTTILNRVTKKNFETGYSKNGETKGLNFILKRNKKNKILRQGVIHIDTPGATRAVAPELLQDRFMTDKFVYDVLPDISDAVVLVVDILTANEQVLIQQLMDNIIKFTSQHRKRQLIVVHNFKTLSTQSDVEEYIQSDIVDAFADVEEVEKEWPIGSDEEAVAFYTSRYKGHYQIVHFVFAQEHTDAGKLYNDIATRYLRQYMDQMLCPAEDVNVLDYFIYRLEPLLREYFHALAPSGINVVVPPFNPYDALVRASRWVDGVWAYLGYRSNDGVQKKELIEIKIEELEQDPFKLIFRPVIGPDETHDGVIVLKNEHALIYCDSDGIGTTPQCRPKVNCVVWNKHDLWSLQCAVPGGEFADSNANVNFTEAVKTKYFLLKNVCELIIYGTLMPFWSPYINASDTADINNFNLMYFDGKMDGWIEKRFKMPETVCEAYNDHARSSQLFEFKNGVLTVNVPLTAAQSAPLVSVKQEL